MRGRSFEEEDPVVTKEERHAGADKLSKIMLQHIFKEENGIFPMADKYIPETEQNAIQRRMDEMLAISQARYESEHGGNNKP